MKPGSKPTMSGINTGHASAELAIRKNQNLSYLNPSSSLNFSIDRESKSGPDGIRIRDPPRARRVYYQAILPAHMMNGESVDFNCCLLGKDFI